MDDNRIYKWNINRLPISRRLTNVYLYYNAIMIAILNILQKFFPNIAAKVRYLLFKLERVPKLPFKEPIKINIDGVSFQWWVKTRKDWWMASNRYTETKQLQALIQASNPSKKVVFGILVQHKEYIQ